ncbi:hypothetical protein SAMN04487969_108160 [Paenibacillus algorifonticola]|uniref:Uncharacterized protein n=1 Tax=Paenibacillus algorifonticola TaxID=684063 RepID=A0A1I2E432_9BACL|nr:hypothetical protein [Paenibacillus algorifonticola]SFE87429.1 hypothetical protein SAMN04487969_108160 [Paenibacillus algorifonticola]
MTKKFNHRITLIAALCLALVAAVVVFTTKEKYTPGAYNVNYSPDYAVSGDVTGLVNNSDYVVSGHYEKFIENWDMGENHLSEVYSFVVDESLLGDVEGTINVSIPHTTLLKYTLDDVEYEAALNSPNYSKPDFDKMYVLFLKKAQTKDVFGPSSVPFQVEVDSAGKVALKANTENGEQTLTAKKGDTIKFHSEQIELASIDKISGLTKDALFREIKTQVAAKEESK